MRIFMENQKTIDEYISEKINAFYKNISGYENEKPEDNIFSRYKSWEWCYKFFCENRAHYQEISINSETEKVEQKKLLEQFALHLGFYLASWGMYRGSSFLLNHDYRVHIPVVKIILEKKYNALFELDALIRENSSEGGSFDDELNKLSKLLFENVDKDEEKRGLYFRIRDAYKYRDNPCHQDEQEDTDNEQYATETLITKIILGTIGCIPAFDRFFIKGLEFSKIEAQSEKINRSVKLSMDNCPNNSFKKLVDIAKNNVFKNRKLSVGKDYDGFIGKNNKGAENDKLCYPIMKLVDMYFWQFGYELSIAETLKEDIKGNETAKKKENLLKKKKKALLSLYTEADLKKDFNVDLQNIDSYAQNEFFNNILDTIISPSLNTESGIWEDYLKKLNAN